MHMETNSVAHMPKVDRHVESPLPAYVMTFAVGYTDAWFEPRNRWGGAKYHAVNPNEPVTGGRHRHGSALCGQHVSISEGRIFDAKSVLACQRCAKATSSLSTAAPID